MKEKRHRFVRKVYESCDFKLSVGYFGFCEKRLILYIDSSVIRQKGESAENACFKKTKHAKFSEKNPVRIIGLEMFVIFRKIWQALFSWNTRFQIRSFALLPMNSNLILDYGNITEIRF